MRGFCKRVCRLSPTFVVVLAACQDEQLPNNSPLTCTDPEVLDKFWTERPDYPLVRQTEHLDIYAEEPQFVCAGMADELERHVRFIGETLGIEPRQHIPYFYTWDVPEQCLGVGVGCNMNDGVSFGVAGVAYHELTHAVACQIQLYAAWPFTEGLATMFEPKALRSFVDDIYTDIDLYELLGAPSPFGDPVYSYGGHFSRWLVERDGGPVFAELYLASRENDSEQVADALEAIYGLSFDEIEAEYQSMAKYVWAPFRQCSDIPHVNRDSDGTWKYAAVMDCDSANTLGPYERGGHDGVRSYMYHSFTFTIDEAVRLEFNVTGTADYDRIYLERCVDHASTEEEWWMEYKPGGVIFDPPLNLSQPDLVPGTWRADVLARHGPPGSIEVGFHEVE